MKLAVYREAMPVEFANRMNSLSTRKCREYRKAVFILAILFVLTILVRHPVKAQENTHAGHQANMDQLLAETIHVLGGVNNRVPQWTSAVYMALVGSVSADVISRIDSLIREISMFTGLEIRLLSHRYNNADDYHSAISQTAPYDLSLCSQQFPNDCANFVVVFSSQKQMGRIASVLPLRPVFQKAALSQQKLHCFFSPGVTANLEIKRSLVFVNNELNEEMVQTCLQEEIYQSFGLFGDYSGARFYSFNNVVAAKALTVYDKILLSSLYDREYPPGTLARSIAKQVVEYCSATC